MSQKVISPKDPVNLFIISFLKEEFIVESSNRIEEYAVLFDSNIFSLFWKNFFVWSASINVKGPFEELIFDKHMNTFTYFPFLSK